MRPDKPQPRHDVNRTRALVQELAGPVARANEAWRKLVAGASRALPPVQVAVLPASRLTCGIICGWLDCT
jgi:hypothetical protein